MVKEKKQKKPKPPKMTAEEKKARARNEKSMIEEVMPVIGWDDNLNVGVMSDGTLVDVLEIRSTNLNSASVDEKAYIQHLIDKQLCTYPGDLKFVFQKFPTNTQEQQEYVKHKITKQKNPALRDLLIEKRNELEFITSNYSDRKFLLFFFAKNADEYASNLSALGTLINANPPVAVPIKDKDEIRVKSKKQQIFKSLYNKTLAV